MSLPPSYNLLEKYPNTHYYETGVWRGDSIQMALDAGFKGIFGMDNDPECIEFCKNRFALHRLDSGFVHGYYPGDHQLIEVKRGDSANDLWKHIQNVRQPITFFLDAHSQMFEDEIPSANPFPLLKELEQIGRHPIRSHTIIIDDLLYMSHIDITGWSRKTIEDAVLAINPAYKFEYVANPIRENLLVCTVKK